ncbi:hypothetical protein FOMG_19770, partial [Fusarium oxysporum f. sp. melonis 26406]
MLENLAIGADTSAMLKDLAIRAGAMASALKKVALGVPGFEIIVVRLDMRHSLDSEGQGKEIDKE